MSKYLPNKDIEAIGFQKVHVFIIKLSQCRGDCDYYQRVPGTQQLSPLEVGEDNLKLEPKNPNPLIWSNKSFIK